MGRFLKCAVLCFMLLFSILTAWAANAYPVKVVGGRHTLVLMSDGTVVGWGPMDRGELGPKAAIPQDTKHATQLVSIKLPRKAIDIAAMYEASLAVLDDGTVVGWGDLLQNGTKQDAETPVPVPGLRDVVKIVATGDSALALRKDGSVYGFGRNSPFANAPVPGLHHIKEISISQNHGMALDGNGDVWTWANNDGALKFGLLGRTTTPSIPTKVEGLSNVVSISAQSFVSTVVKKDGTVWVWGSNNAAQLGNGRKSDMPNRGRDSEVVIKPQQVSGISNAASLANTSNAVHTLVLMKDGTLRSWGNSQLGQAGDGKAGDYVTRPVASRITGVKAIFGIGMNSYAIRNDNALWMWGANTTWGFPYNKTLSAPTILRLK